MMEAIVVVGLIGGIVLIMLAIAVIAGIILYRKGKRRKQNEKDTDFI